jgi:aromatic-amino-acid transaminase
LIPSVTRDHESALIPEAAGRPSDDPIFSLDAEAARRAAAGESILNATLGALMTDEGRLAVMPSVSDAIARVPAEKAAAYAPIAGDPPFLRAVVADLFGDGPLAGEAVAAATPGATGALHHAVLNFLEPGQAALTASYFWSPYRVIAQHARRALEVFDMFDADMRFGLRAFEERLHAQIARQGRALVFFNFPCNNPTGYSLDPGEWQAVSEIVQRAGRRAPVAFLLDHAYAKFGNEASQAWVDHVPTMLETATVLVGWTVSKAFAQYGARVGALVALHPDAEERRRLANAMSYSCRATWSNCNHLGLLAVTELLTDSELRRRSTAERQGLIRLLDERVAAFNAAATRAGLAYPRYEGGFFVSVFTPDAERTAAVMREGGVYVVPMAGAVRVALCGTPVGAIPRLVASLAEGVAAAEAARG